MSPTEADRVAHILDAIRTVEHRVAGLDEEGFSADEVVRDSVLYQLAIIGEAANGLTDEMQAKHGEIPWGQIVGFRNRLMHEYHSVNLAIVWRTIQKDLPELKTAMEREYDLHQP